MHVFHIVSFRPTRYVLKRFRCLEFSNRVKKLNKFKNNIYVRSKLQLLQLQIPIFINKLMCQSSFVFCEFNRVASWNEGKTIILYDHHFKFPNINTGFLFKVNQFQWKNMYFPSSKFEGNFSTYVFRKSFWYYRELKIDCWASWHIFCEKNIKSFRKLEITILVEKWDVY